MPDRWYAKSIFGWGNGYVAIPKGHPFFGMSYDDIQEKYDIRVHGGLTFSSDSITGQPEDTKGMWIVGFDTGHINSSKLFPDEQSVIDETIKLKKQIERYSLGTKINKLLDYGKADSENPS